MAVMLRLPVERPGGPKVSAKRTDYIIPDVIFEGRSGIGRMIIGRAVTWLDVR
jgi:hypothetical protein